MELLGVFVFSLFVFWDEVISQDEGISIACTIGDSEEPNGVMYEGRCVDLYEEGVCGEDALGERLFLSEDGTTVYCDCDEGWMRHEGRCYQEFTRAFCPQNQILNLGNYKRIRDGQKYNCKRNPCLSPTLLPHKITWNNRFCHDVSALEDIKDCELFPSNPDVDKSPMKCCTPTNRDVCHTLVSIQPALLPGNRRCRRRQIWSRIRKKCITLGVRVHRKGRVVDQAGDNGLEDGGQDPGEDGHQVGG